MNAEINEKDSNQKLIEEIRKRARSYTPEWRFDTENPDIGSALAIVYARMMSQTIKKLSRVPVKNRITFLNSLGADLLPAVPSEGYVQFSLVNEEVEGTPVNAGTMVSANTDDAPDGQVSFETLDALYVTPAVISDIYRTDDKTDSIVRLYDKQEKKWEPCPLFSYHGTNRQRHEFYFSNDLVFNIQNEAYIEIAILTDNGSEIDQNFLRELADEKKAVFEYFCENERWEAFDQIDAPHQYLKLHKAENQPAFAKCKIDGEEDFWIRVRLLDITMGEKLKVQRLEVASMGMEVLPDTIYGVQEERDLRRCLPFGERLDLYEETYFGSEEVLSKRNAKISLSFRVDFARVPLDTNESLAFNWEWVMKRSDFKPNLEFDVTIENVIWEYYNGSGWTKLFPDDSYGRVFSTTEGMLGQYTTMEFTCPADIEKILINATETYYIRARITKINNLYKLSGRYVLPVIENISMKYTYQERKAAKNYLLKNNLEIRRPDRENGLSFLPFSRTGTDVMTAYFGFRKPPVGSPLKILFKFSEAAQIADSHLLWEYWNGNKWKNINPIDETEQLSKTGMVSFTGNPDIREKTLFGKERYWIRIRDVENVYRDVSSAVLLDFYMNTTRVRQIQNRRTELFQMELYQADQVFKLQEKNIYEAEVWVEETGLLSEQEMADLKAEKRLDTEHGPDGVEERVWVRWEWKDDFYSSQGKDRHFVIHRLSGELQFGDGIHGRIPSSSGRENIRISYTSGGGEYTNLPEGMVDRLGRAMGFISEVVNRGSMTGGCDQETLEEGVRRMTSGIRHQNRAISARDYEELACSASRDILAAKCFSGYDDMGKELYGGLTLVVLHKDYRHGGMHFTAVRNRVFQDMKNRMPPALFENNRFFIVPPEFVEIRLYVELTVEDFNLVFQVKEEIMDRLAVFLDPIHGKDGAGWEIGTFPNAFQIQNAISDIEGIAYIEKLVMNTYSTKGSEGMEMDVGNILRNRYILPVNGEHEIVIRV